MRRVLISILGIIASWLMGAVIVRVSLDAVDRIPYSPASEVAYLAIAFVALSVAIGGTVLCVVILARRS
jgi:hypothetical protein